MGHPVPGGLKYRDVVVQIWGLDARLTTLLCKKIIVTKSKEVKTGCNRAESSTEGCGSKRTVLPMMMMMMMMINENCSLPNLVYRLKTGHSVIVVIAIQKCWRPTVSELVYK
jgi:hypothetical protein